LLARDFATDDVNQKWAGEITYIWTRKDWLSLAVILNLHSRGNGRQPDEAWLGDPGFENGDCLARTTQGAHPQNGLGQWMSANGNCYENAAVETFFTTINAAYKHLGRHESATGPPGPFPPYPKG
jgi:transposase InsO family protein|tara:strand:+ start:787 stop:1161 length:375 start_codon:yes stop_codon:yes gene_type:complete